nr:MAG TPA: hypothetical protein [Caudoviricetes sp.]
MATAKRTCERLRNAKVLIWTAKQRPSVDKQRQSCEVRS